MLSLMATKPGQPLLRPFPEEPSISLSSLQVGRAPAAKLALAKPTKRGPRSVSYPEGKERRRMWPDFRDSLRLPGTAAPPAGGASIGALEPMAPRGKR